LETHGFIIAVDLPSELDPVFASDRIKELISIMPYNIVDCTHLGKIDVIPDDDDKGENERN